MTTQEKQQIADALAIYCQRMGSQDKAANTLKGVSGPTISRILGGEMDIFKDEMFRSISAQIGFTKKKWVTVETRDFKLMTGILADAQENALVLAVTGEAGSGKSLAICAYGEENKNVFALCCSEFWNRKIFLQELLRVMGKDSSGDTVGDMMAEVVRGLKRSEMPILVLDEADKLTDQVLYFFISLYNQLEDQCGIVLTATDHLEKRIKRGLRLNKKGYKEIYSRMGRKFIKLQGASPLDIAEVCRANGVTDAVTIKKITTDCEMDLRRVRRKVHADKKLKP